MNKRRKPKKTKTNISLTTLLQFEELSKSVAKANLDYSFTLFHTEGINMMQNLDPRVVRTIQYNAIGDNLCLRIKVMIKDS